MKDYLLDTFRILNVHLSHATGVGRLPPLHSDPFDRLLISQAMCEGLTLLSDDTAIRRYHLSELELL
jgi:PIN domain nuclease of toxin-antitoxin system